MPDELTDSELAIQDHVLVEAEVYGQPVFFRTMIVKVTPDELWLGLASPDKRLETMRPDQAIRLTVARNDAALLGQSGFLRPLGGSKSRIFAVVRPGALERVQRRSHVRYPMDVSFHFRNVDPATREPRGKAATGQTINVSPGGMLVQCEVPGGVGEELAITLPLSGEDRISMLGVVTRVRRADDGQSNGATDSERTELAVRFTRITAVDQERLMRFILMMEHRRRELALRQPPPQVAVPAAPQYMPVSVPAAVSTNPVAAPRSAAPVERPAIAPVPAPVPAPAPAPAAPKPAPLPLDPDLPLIAVGLHLCEGGQATDVRLWFDSLMPGSRIELLSLLQANMAGGSVPGAAEPASVRPLAVALGLLAA